MIRLVVEVLVSLRVTLVYDLIASDLNLSRRVRCLVLCPVLECSACSG